MTDETYLRLEGILKRYGNFKAVDDLTLGVDEGNCLALLGPSGCGKTTTLNIVAGFAVPDAGKIVLDGRDITAIPPHRRDFGMVFQDYALFPHLTVLQNVSFGLRMRGVDRERTRKRAAEALDLVGLPNFSERYPTQLSGGQRQRVALARAIVIRPTLLLFDEPLSNLDARLREEMRGEIRKLLDETKITAIFVTHDQSEAFAIADRVALLNAGSVEQFGLPHELYDRPRTVFAATFVGGCNLIAAQVVESGPEHLSLRIEQSVVELPRHIEPSGRDVILVVRPQYLRIMEGGPLTGTVRRLEYLGSQTKLAIESSSGTELSAELPGRVSGIRAGDPIAFGFDRDRTWMLEKAN